jgi:hypothetical protein
LNNKAQGVIDATNSYLPLIIDTGANTVTNAGALKADYGSELFIASNLNNTGTLNATYGTILLAGTVTGTGTATINGTGQVEFGAASSNGTKFDRRTYPGRLQALHRHDLWIRDQYNSIH